VSDGTYFDASASEQVYQWTTDRAGCSSYHDHLLPSFHIGERSTAWSRLTLIDS
jgi:hypothetical protein